MKSRGKLIFTSFAAVIVGLAAFDYYSAQQKEKGKDKASLLLKMPVDQIQSFSIKTEKTEIELQKDKDSWRLTKPLNDLADANAATQFLEGLATEKAFETAVEGAPIRFNDLGLEKPLAVFSVRDYRGQTTIFKLGSQRNFQGDSFIQTNDEQKVVISGSTWFAKAEKKALDFRDKRLMRFPNSQVTSVTFEKGKNRFELIKKEDQWVIQEKPEWRLDQNRVRELLAMLNTTELLEYIVDGEPKPEELRQWSLNNPRLRMTVGLKDQEPWIAEFAAGTDKVHRLRTSRPSYVLKISPTDSDKFFSMNEDSFRDRMEPFLFDKNLVKNIRIKLGGMEKTLNVDEEKAKSLLKALADLKVHQYRFDSSARLSDEIILKGETSDLLKLQWGHLQKEKDGVTERKIYFAKTERFPQGFTLKEEDIVSLKLDEILPKESVK